MMKNKKTFGKITVVGDESKKNYFEIRNNRVVNTQLYTFEQMRRIQNHA